MTRPAEDLESDSNPVEETRNPRKKLKSEHSPTYILDGLLRKVEPYDHVFESFCKGRWVGKELLDVFMTEFRDRSHAYYGVAIDQGRVKVDGQKVPRTHKVKNAELITHSLHRHEPPVLNVPIEIVSDTKDMIVVNKPPSIPVHPTGRYTHNSLINILRHEMGINAVHPINRIDRLTSGLVLIAKNRFTAQEKSKEMQSRNISKTYLCRVRGDFPEGEIVCEEPLAVFAHKLGINHVNANGKESKTIFKKLSFNGRTSVVEAKPLTGRTHQIRVHLQFLGYPIANDPLYASDLWGPDGGKGNLDQERLASITAQLSKRLAQDPKEDEETEAEVVFCLDCAQSRSDPDPDLMSIWLHSVRYEGESWSYETALPCWASEDFDGDQRVMDKGHLVIQLD